MVTRRIGLVALASALVIATAACGSDSGTEPTATESVSPAPSTPSAPDSPEAPEEGEPSPPEESPDVPEDASPEPTAMRKTTFIANNVTLWNSEESDLGFRVLFESPASQVRVRLRGVPADNQVVSVCPVRGLTQTSPGNTCTYPANTQQVEIRHASRFNGVEVLLLGTAPGGGERLTLGQIRVIFNGPESGQVTTVKTPPILRPPKGRPCKNNSCNPTFQITPTNTGRLRATTTFEGAGRAELAVESGGDTIDSRQSAGDLRVSGRITANGDPLIALRNTGSRTLGIAVTEIAWP